MGTKKKGPPKKKRKQASKKMKPKKKSLPEEVKIKALQLSTLKLDVTLREAKMIYLELEKMMTRGLTGYTYTVGSTGYAFYPTKSGIMAFQNGCIIGIITKI